MRTNVWTAGLSIYLMTVRLSGQGVSNRPNLESNPQPFGCRETMITLLQSVHSFSSQYTSLVSNPVHVFIQWLPLGNNLHPLNKHINQSLFYISVTFCPREDHLCAANQNDPLRRARLRFTRDYVSQTGTLTQGCGIFRTDQCSRKGPCLTWLFLHALFIITPHFVTDSFFYPLVVIFHVAWFLKPLRARALCVSGLSLGDHLGPHTTDTRSEISPAGVNSFYSTRRSVHLTVRAVGGTGSHCLVLVPSHCADAPPFSLSLTHTHVIVSHKCTLSGDDGLLL